MKKVLANATIVIAASLILSACSTNNRAASSINKLTSLATMSGREDDRVDSVKNEESLGARESITDPGEPNYGSDNDSMAGLNSNSSTGGSGWDYQPTITSQIEFYDLTDQQEVCNNSAPLLGGHRVFKPEAGHHYRMTFAVRHIPVGYAEDWPYEHSIAHNVDVAVDFPLSITPEVGQLSIIRVSTCEENPAQKIQNEILVSPEDDLRIVYEPNSACELRDLVRYWLWFNNDEERVISKDDSKYRFSHVIPALLYGETRIFSFEFSVLTEAEYQNTYSDSLGVELMGMYNGSEEHPGPSFTTLRNAVKSGTPYFEEPIDGENYYATFRITPPRSARRLAGENAGIFTGLTACSVGGNLRFAADLMAGDIVLDTASLVYDFPSYEGELKIDQAVFWSVQEVDLPAAVYSPDTGIYSAYQPEEASYSSRPAVQVNPDKPALHLNSSRSEDKDGSWYSMYNAAPSSVEGGFDHAVYVTYRLISAMDLVPCSAPYDASMLKNPTSSVPDGDSFTPKSETLYDPLNNKPDVVPSNLPDGSPSMNEKDPAIKTDVVR